MSINWIQFFGGLGLGVGLSFMIQWLKEIESPTKKDNEKEEDSDDEWESDESDESDEESDENEVSNGIGPTKMVLAVRMDLKMGKGKIAAQCGHASVSAFKKAKLKSPELVKAWEYEGSRKIAVKVKDEDDLLTVLATAKSLGLITAIIQDAGRTQIEAGSKTVVAIGPGPEELIDQVTRHFGLL